MLCILQARMSSKRLPNKMLKNIEGKTLLLRVYNQLQKSKYIKKIVVATSKSRSDDPLERYCKLNKIKVFRGSKNNVALRFYKLLKKNTHNYFVRVSGDSPLIDFRLIDKMAKYSKKQNFDIITNLMPRTFPKGHSVEIIKTKFFLKYFGNIKDRFDKEHVTPFFYKRKKEFKIKSFISKKKFKKFNYCIDYKRDLEKIIKLLKICNNKIPSLNRLDKIVFN